MMTMLAIDFEVMKRQLVPMCAIGLCLCALFPFVLGTSYMIVPFLCLIISYAFLLSLFACDEQRGWGSYLMALPITRSGAVAGRYMGLLAVAAAISLLASSITLVCVLALGNQASEELPFALAICLSSIVPPVLLGSIMLPLLFRFGLTRATRILMIVFVVLPFAMMPTAVELMNAGFADALAGAMPWLVGVLSSGMGLVAASVLLLACTLALFAVSAAVSTRLLAHRDL